MWRRIGTGVVGVGLLGVLLAACSSSGGPYAVSVYSFVPLNTHQILVDVRVTNNGSSAGTPSCSLTAKTPNQTYFAGELFQPKHSLTPGQSTVIQVTATVSDNAAGQVRKSNITARC